ncbi:MAG: hypothetical protein K9J27_12830 [Bacteroidales bacterium]|nr:hypothetical protein [Bacteroidales bacterium]MCF8336317.1 hypothetical protein [Bacteroidales bacterium]
MKRKMPENSHSKDKSPISGYRQGWLLFVLFAGLLLMGCKHPWEREKKHSIQTDSISNEFISIADSINYGVVIKARNDADDWQKKWLRSFDRKELVDFIFEAVYSGKLQPYDYFDDKPIAIEQIKQLENKEEFERSKVGKIQFKERWYFDTNRLQMIKKVYSIMLAYEVYKENGAFRGYKPAFKVYLNESVDE